MGGDIPSPNPSRKREGNLIRLDASTADFADAFTALVNARREADDDVARRLHGRGYCR